MSISTQFQAVFRKAQQWLTKTPERALDQAYEAALRIKRIEDDHFDGNPIAPGYGNYGDSALSYFQGEVKKYLTVIKMRMTEFRTSSLVFRVENTRQIDVQLSEHVDEDYTLDLIDQPAIFFKKLRFVDDILERYDTAPEPVGAAIAKNGAMSLSTDASGQGKITARGTGDQAETELNTGESKREGLADAAGVLPRSILRTVDRVKQDLDPKAEAQVVRDFRSSQGKTKMALRFVLLLVIVPLLAQQLSKNLVIGPIVDRVRETTHAEVFLNDEMEEEALHELQQFEEKLRFEVLIGKVAPIGELKIEEQVRERAFDIEEDYRLRSSSAVKNVFADIFAVLSFGVLLTICKRQVATLKAFMDEIVYGLSDSAKAFIIILFTDMFVGFHSPHGWEVLLEGLSHHLGFATNREFIFLFIATFPVILDTVFKYWIFRYLNRISPSAVATYKNMNE
ncbi:MAG: proton extrusion protein PcxA [Cyanobacteria bacterium P01_A01_bin.114]